MQNLLGTALIGIMRDAASAAKAPVSEKASSSILAESGELRKFKTSDGNKDFPGELVEQFRLVPPDSEAGIKFNALMTEHAKKLLVPCITPSGEKLFDGHDFEKTPIQFCLCDSQSVNAGYIQYSNPPIIILNKGLFSKDGVESIDQLMGIVAHEYGHYLQNQRGYSYGKASEIDADHWMILLSESGGYKRSAGAAFLTRHGAAESDPRNINQGIRESLDPHPSKLTRPKFLDASMAAVKGHFGAEQNDRTETALPPELSKAVREAEHRTYYREMLDKHSYHKDSLKNKLEVFEILIDSVSRCSAAVHQGRIEGAILLLTDLILESSPETLRPQLPLVKSCFSKIEEQIRTRSSITHQRSLNSHVYQSVYKALHHQLGKPAPLIGAFAQLDEALRPTLLATDLKPEDLRNLFVSAANLDSIAYGLDGNFCNLVSECSDFSYLSPTQDKPIPWDTLTKVALTAGRDHPAFSEINKVLGVFGIVDSRLLPEAALRPTRHIYGDFNGAWIIENNSIQKVDTHSSVWKNTCIEKCDEAITWYVSKGDTARARDYVQTLKQNLDSLSFGIGTKVEQKQLLGLAALKHFPDEVGLLNSVLLYINPHLQEDLINAIKEVGVSSSADEYRNVLLRISKAFSGSFIITSEQSWRRRLPGEYELNVAPGMQLTLLGNFFLGEIGTFLKGQELESAISSVWSSLEENEVVRNGTEALLLARIAELSPDATSARELGSALSLEAALDDTISYLRAIGYERFHNSNGCSLIPYVYALRVKEGLIAGSPVSAASICNKYIEVLQVAEDLKVTNSGKNEFLDSLLQTGENKIDLASLKQYSLSLAHDVLNVESRLAIQGVFATHGISFSQNPVLALDEWCALKKQSLISVKTAYETLPHLLESLQKQPAEKELLALYRLTENDGLADLTCKSSIIQRISQLLEAKLGADDGSKLYREEFAKAFSQELQGHLLSKSMRIDLCQAVLSRLSAQPETVAKCTQQILKNAELDRNDFKYMNLGGVGADVLVQYCRDANFRRDLIAFLASPITPKTLGNLTKSLHALPEMHNVSSLSSSDESKTLLRHQPEVLLPLIHENFWGLDIQARAVVGQQLLFHSHEIHSPEGEKILRDILHKVFPGRSANAKLFRELAELYVTNSEPYMQEIIAGAFFFSAYQASEAASGSKEDQAGVGLRSFLESTPPVGGKIGQQLPGYGNLPDSIAKPLETFKEQYALPKIWEFYSLAQRVLPETIYSKITHWKDTNRAGTIAFTAVVEHAELGEVILQLKRPNVDIHGRDELAVYTRSLEQLANSPKRDKQKIAASGKMMVAHTEHLLAQETDFNRLAELNSDMAKVSSRSITLSDQSEIKFNGPEVLAHGSDWIIQKLLPGRSLNEVLKDPSVDSSLKRRYAEANLRFELGNALSGRGFNEDPHSGNVKVDNDRMYCYDAGCFNAEVSQESLREIGQLMGNMSKQMALSIGGSNKINFSGLSSLLPIDSSMTARGFMRVLSCLSQYVTTQDETGQPLVSADLLKEIIFTSLDEAHPAVKEGFKSAMPAILRKIAGIRI